MSIFQKFQVRESYLCDVPNNLEQLTIKWNTDLPKVSLYLGCVFSKN